MSEAITLSQFLTGALAAYRDDSPAGSRTFEAAGNGPVLGSLPVDAGEFSGVRYQAPDDYVVRELRGAKMRTVAGVFDEFAAAFQFPYYFGENKDAFDECLLDLDEFVGRVPGYVAVVRDSSQLLTDESGQRDWFTTAMTDCAARWATHGVVFRVVLQGSPADLDAVALTL